ncbi:MAG: DUF4179 domain-containing protein [Oscillospiraceae bacterium]
MRTTDERLNAVKNRTFEMKKTKKIRQNRILMLSSFAASLAIIVGMSISFPDIMKHISLSEYGSASNVGSIFSNGNAIGYVMIAIVAFCLGVCVTILCMQLHKKNKENTHDDRDN